MFPKGNYIGISTIRQLSLIYPLFAYSSCALFFYFVNWLLFIVDIVFHGNALEYWHTVSYTPEMVIWEYFLDTQFITHHLDTVLFRSP